MSELPRRPAGDGAEVGHASTARIHPLDGFGLILVRADLRSDAGATLERLVELPLPGVRQAQLAQPEGRSWFWMAPDELLLRVPSADVGGILPKLEAVAAEQRVLAVDMSDSRAIFQIAGPKAREVLSKGVAVDLHPDRFRPGDFRRTRMAGVAVAFAMTGEEPDSFELLAARSYAAYLRNWLARAAEPG